MVKQRHIEVRLLGPVEVVVDGEPVDLGGVRQRLLVARLGLGVGRPVPVDTLLDLLWPDEIPDAAIGNLQSYVSRVRRRIGKELIVKEPGGYRLTLERSQVDALQVDDALTRLDELDPMARAEALDEARRRWRGGSLSDLADWLGLVPDAVRLDELRLHVIGLWAAAVLDIDRHDLALSVLPSLAGQHPTNEPIQLALMEALARARRNDDALRIGHRFRTALAEASGLQPSGALAQLEQRILADPEPTVLPAGVPLPPANSFLGRDQELHQIAGLIEPPGVVEVVGPAGVGKTRLVLELLHRPAEARPARFVDLATISEPDRLVAAIAGAIGVHIGGSAADLADALEANSVLVIDACEHLAHQTGAVVNEIARRRDDVTIVCTSRTRLVTNSRGVDLAPLHEVDATRLFLERAEQNRPGFDSTAVRAEALETLVAVTDGLPLAVELLSGRERIVGVDVLARQAVTERSLLGPATSSPNSSTSSIGPTRPSPPILSACSDG